MINKESAFKEGFIKKAQQYGLSIKQAEFLFSKKAGIGGDVASWAGRTSADLLPPGMDMPPEVAALFSPVVGSGAGLIGGGALGAGIGALNGTKDQNGETHRVKNALKGAFWGGGLGTLAGGGIGAGIGGAIATHPSAYNSGHYPSVMSNMFEEAARPVVDGARELRDTAKNLFKSFTR